MAFHKLILFYFILFHKWRTVGKIGRKWSDLESCQKRKKRHCAPLWVHGLEESRPLARDIRTPGDDRRENIFHSFVKKFETFLKCSHFSFKQCSCAYTNCLTLNSFIQQFRVNQTGSFHLSKSFSKLVPRANLEPQLASEDSGGQNSSILTSIYKEKKYSYIST